MTLVGGRVAVVTGAAQSIGLAIAEDLADHGAGIAVVVINEAGAEAAAAALRARGVTASAFPADVSSFEQMTALVPKVLDVFPTVDILVNNAGITRDNLVVRMSEEEWDSVLRVNLKSAFNCSRAFARQMIKQRSGRIINIASVIGLMGNVGQANYAASKAGMIGLTKSLARELAPRGITVNAVAPGYIDTAMTHALPEAARQQLMALVAIKRMGRAEDVAAAVTFLASERASYITGQVLNVDGGMVMH